MIKLLKYFYQRQQFNPGFVGLWINPFFHARRGIFQAIAKIAPKIEGRVLDVGCGQKPYQELFKVTEYVGLEMDTAENRSNKQADFFYDGTTFPFKDKSFDTVICNQVLEHVFTPDVFLTEIFRVLKPNGKLLLTVPFVWDEHEQPWDYARYSSFGLKHLLEKSEFKIIEQYKINADVRVILQLVNAYLYKSFYSSYKSINVLFCMLFLAPFNIFGLLFYKLLPDNLDLFLDQIVLAKKV